MDSGLYVVATPIGNLGDISRRALEVLAAADLVAAEDTRTTRNLLAKFNIDNQVLAYHDHSDARAGRRILDCVTGGGVVALVSDAGTPLISDPGYRLVRDAQEAGLVVFPVPGPCAAVAALSASGLPTDRFLFEGFLPGKATARQGRLAELAQRPETLVFYEAPHRVLECLADMVEAFGAEREALLARELTKAFETLRRAPLADLQTFVAADSNQQRGEIVLVVAGQRDRVETIDADSARLLRRLAQELPPKRAAAVVADLTGLRKKQLYDFLLQQD
ncbi:16S rRNA (cytidine(1402)-2'-O)-methyltransferase [Parahaliea aestuarii]|uniref:Ribosomal RNA small subunit methyltransferase I n=1 Tax=Parahaliea aestuarii TaxID=1852021 RepID=A0A5C9A322_9GAMM|nr:16S rRNA (cytidine(1402)-2'-O)-methyltransferase [Parahaliea aestuarii]TXS95158.1 16S rRNA (cytidine(1402)-2'-O)-methyltransferase [Parahaliea aestuarii]